MDFLHALSMLLFWTNHRDAKACMVWMTAYTTIRSMHKVFRWRNSKPDLRHIFGDSALDWRHRITSNFVFLKNPSVRVEDPFDKWKTHFIVLTKVILRIFNDFNMLLEYNGDAFQQKYDCKTANSRFWQWSQTKKKTCPIFSPTKYPQTPNPFETSRWTDRTEWLDKVSLANSRRLWRKNSRIICLS